MEIIYLIAAFYFGCCIGSFLNVVIWRLPQGLSLGGRSFCPNCHHQLAWYDLLPVFSVIWRKFACDYCSKKISIRYILIECLTGLLFALSYWFIDPQVFVDFYQLLGFWFVISISMIIFVIDYEHYLILDKVMWPSIIFMVGFLLGKDLLSNSLGFNLDSHLINGILGTVLIAGFFYSIWLVSQGKWIGFGDVKLAIFIGLALGWAGGLVALFIAFMLGSIVGVGLMVFANKGLQSKLPFGTFLTIGMVISLFFGSDLAQVYMQLIGLR